jgi:hypothetical protein
VADDDADTVRDVADFLGEAKRIHGDALVVNQMEEWDALVAKLRRAAELIDPSHPGDADRRKGRELVNEAASELRIDFGQIGPWGNEELRLAALDASRRLDGLIGT